MSTKEKIWILLSELFVDAEHTDNELRWLGKSLKETGCTIQEIEKTLKYEVAPVCGKWMYYPIIGPWPMFDEEDLKKRIQNHIDRPWYWPPLIKNGLWGLSGVRKDWQVVKSAINES